MKALKVDHIGIAVTSLEEGAKMYEAMGLKMQGVEEVAEQKVKVGFFPVGDTEVELLESTDPEGPIAKFIEKNGGRGGIQHLAFRVDNVAEAIESLKAAGVPMIDQVPRYGAGGAKIAFIHPKATGGVLIELSER
ncbi:MAG TPA: methylmalonyl-CoA epimerase [Bacillota bacterium]|nr:methylmalonyl-CoA epimerase [Bacillota bacterium]HOG52785.1 methylmalonyl-CoA epimerase [Bacillota bacterium]